jgi:hypothetical protein
VVADDDTAQERPVTCVVMIIEKVFESFGQLEVLRITGREHSLQAEDGWEGLQLNQARCE